MKKNTTIDLAKFQEAQQTISSIQDQFYEMVVETINNLGCLSCWYSDTLGYFFSYIEVSGLSVELDIKVFDTQRRREKTGYRNVTKLEEIQFRCYAISCYDIVINMKHIRQQLKLYCTSMPLPSHYTFNGRKLTITKGKRIL